MLDAERALVAARRQSRDSQLLTMVNERLHKSLDRRDVLFGIVEGVRAAFSADRCFVYERMADGDHATVVAAAVKGGGATHAQVGGCARCGFAQGVRRSDGAPRRDRRRADLWRRRSQCDGAAVRRRRARRGRARALVRSAAMDSTTPIIAALRSLAFHVGLALSNARLYERERARRAQAESLERVVRILRDTQYVDEVLLVFVVTVSHELPLDCAAYALEGDPDGAPGACAYASRAVSSLRRRSIAALLEPFLAVDEPSDASMLPRVARDALFDGRSGVIVPLRLEGTLWGCFIVRAAEGGLDWPAEERSTFFRTLGSHLEIALANAHAYERELRRAQERETFAEAARTILSHTAIGSLADVMCRLAIALVHADRACVLRWNGERYDDRRPLRRRRRGDRSPRAASTSCIAPSGSARSSATNAACSA